MRSQKLKASIKTNKKDMKKNNKICLSLNDEELNRLQEFANKERRPLANAVYILVIDALAEKRKKDEQ